MGFGPAYITGHRYELDHGRLHNKMSKLTLRASQRAALKRLCEPGRTFAALWAEPRSGKTTVSLLWLEHVKPGIAIVVGPKVAEAVWRVEAAKWLTTSYRFYPLTAGHQYPTLAQLNFDGLVILFVNYEQFGKAPYKRLRPFLAKVAKIAEGSGAMLLDESHQIKTPNSVFGKHIRPLAHKWKYRLIITGTPVTNPNQIDAIYGQWTFLDPSIRNHWETARDFREHFGEWTNVKGYPELIRPIRQYELNAYIQGNVVTMTGAANPVKVQKVYYRPPSEVLLASKLLLKHGLVEYKNGQPQKFVGDGNRVVPGLNPLVRLLRMRTIVAGWAKDDTGDAFSIKAAAVARLKALGKVLGRTQGKAIIAATHLHEIAHIKGYLRARRIPHITITGRTKDKNLVVEKFQRGSYKVLIVQPRTVAMAIDISVANDLIWYTSDFNYVTFKQTSDRIKLSPANPTVWFICGRGTVDEDVWITLQEDQDHLRKVIRRIKRVK